MKKVKWSESDICLSDLKKIKSLRHSRTAKSWIYYYHNGIPAFTIEDGYLADRWDLPPIKLLKFNIFCFRDEIIEEIVPNNYRLAQENDWKDISEDLNQLNLLFQNKFNGEHYSYISFSEDKFLISFDVFNDKPNKLWFIRDFERTAFFKYKNVIITKDNQLQYQNLMDLVGYPRFMIRLIEKTHTNSL